MTEEEIIQMYEEMKEYFKNEFPNFEQEPIRFKHYVKLFKFYKQRNTVT